MSRRTRRSSPRRCCRSWPDVRPTAQSCGPVWDRQSAPRCRPRAAPWPRHAHSHHWLPLPPWSPGACEARQPVCGALGTCSEMPAAATTRECIHPPCPWPRRYRRQHVCLVPSSTPFLARFGLEALATVRVEEDTGAVPRSDTGSVAFGRNGLSSSNGRLVRNRPLAHCDRFSGHKGAGKTGCWLAPAVSCAIGAEKTHTSLQGSAGASGLPCAMVLRLMPCSPRRRIRLATVAGELAARIARLSFANLRRLDTSHGCQDHTVLPYATAPFVWHAQDRSRETALRSACAPDAIASTATCPNVRDDGRRPSGGTGCAEL